MLLTVLAAAGGTLAGTGVASAAESRGVFEIRMGGGVCLGEVAPRPETGAPEVEQTSCGDVGSTGPAARWEITEISVGFTQIINRRSGRCLDWQFNSGRTEVLLETQPCNPDRPEQLWTYDRVAGLQGKPVTLRNGRGAGVLRNNLGPDAVTRSNDTSTWVLKRVE
jgi:hypothetical protein